MDIFKLAESQGPLDACLLYCTVITKVSNYCFEWSLCPLHHCQVHALTLRYHQLIWCFRRRVFVPPTRTLIANHLELFSATSVL